MKDFKILIVLGKSGSGKGTQVEKLAQQFGLKVISSGNLLRARAEQDDFVGKKIAETLSKGGLIPTPIIFHLWLHELEAAREDALMKGIVFEGSPRKLYEAYLMDEVLEFYGLSGAMRVVHLAISDEEAMKRLLSRGRSDDQEMQIKERLRWYQDEVMPAIDYYQKKGLLTEIQGEQPVEKVYEEVLQKLGDFFGS